MTLAEFSTSRLLSRSTGDFDSAWTLPGGRLASASDNSSIPNAGALLDELTWHKLMAYSRGELSAMGQPVRGSVILDAVALLVGLQGLSASRPQVAADGEGGLDIEARLNEALQVSLHVTQDGIDGVVQRRGTLDGLPIEADDVASAIERVRNATS